jgi:hypothetical protein
MGMELDLQHSQSIFTSLARSFELFCGKNRQWPD